MTGSITVSRRDFVAGASLALLSLTGMKRALAAESSLATLPLVRGDSPYFALPKDFSCQLISCTGDAMTDGFHVPGEPDSMACFSMEGGLTAIVRNHENQIDNLDLSPFGKEFELLKKLDHHALYDRGKNTPALGGCSTVIYDTKTQSIVRQFLSLAGTDRNCSGGATPWGTWISSEESVVMPGGEYTKAHGFNFEVTPTLTPKLSAPAPLKAMGRFRHEAVVVDAKTGFVYQTEDREDGLLYRFIPSAHGLLAMGGKLQALVVRDQKSLDTRNWDAPAVKQGDKLACDWVDMENVESPQDDLRNQGFAKGAALFARGEGMCVVNGAIYFTCTNGGAAKRGQIWRITPDESGGVLELFVESASLAHLNNPDNLCFAPLGGMYVCEDGSGAANRILYIDIAGNVRTFAENIFNGSELSGVCFSPDGSTMFVSIQHDPGMTFAITGPWERITKPA